ncbi:MAG: Ig-like domain-containing protein [Desulfuromonadales bacterium]|nr:Ig-like domain-containing protein [Desulfuromonadales bacterium]
MRRRMEWKTVAISLVLACLVMAGCGDSDRDETIPALTIDLPAAGEPPLSDPVKAETVELSGTAEAGATVELRNELLANVPVAVSVEAGEGGQNWRAVVPVAVGANLVTVTATDRAGNIHLQRLVLVRTEGPLLTAFTPADQATGVPTEPAITATFDEEVQQPLVADSFQLLSAAGPLGLDAPGYDPVTRTVTLTPTLPLALNTAYRVIVSPATATAKVMDVEGNVMLEKSWTFTTAEVITQ